MHRIFLANFGGILDASLGVKILNFSIAALSVILLPFYVSAGPDVLPKGVNSPMFNYGVVHNIGQRFEGNGSLWKMGDLRSVEYNSKYLTKVSPEAKNLITALDAFGRDHGQNINYGVLKFDIDPKIQYFAPVYAYGVTNNWTLAVAAPVLTFEVEIAMRTINSNLESYQSIYKGRVSDDLNRALNLDIKTETLKAIEQRGYKPLTNQKQQFFSDVQLISIYRLQKSKYVDTFYLATMGLPTGPKYDPDDLVALNTFGNTSMENTFAATFKPGYGIGLTPYLGYKYILPDTITARVPLDEEDSLPNATQKEDVSRRQGGQWILKSEIDWKMSNSITLATAYIQNQKAADHFSGGQGTRYDLLGINTNQREELYSIKFSFNTVKAYFSKKALFPFMVYYEFSDMFRGENVYRRTLHEFNFKMFF